MKVRKAIKKKRDLRGSKGVRKKLTSYQEKLKDIKWLEFRSDMVHKFLYHDYKFDEMYCKVCGQEMRSAYWNEVAEPRYYEAWVGVLNLHHNFYIEGREPWDYPDWAFSIFHARCHERFHSISEVPVYTEQYFQDNINGLQEQYDQPWKIIDTILRTFEYPRPVNPPVITSNLCAKYELPHQPWQATDIFLQSCKNPMFINHTK